MILTVGNIKGGVGKSTLACNIAVHMSGSGSDVLLIDGDKQGSAIDFFNARSELLGETGFTCVRSEGMEIIGQVKNMMEKFDHIVIDAGGQDNPSLRAGLVMSDCVLIPVSPRSFETWALDGMIELVNEATIQNEKLHTHIVLNFAFPRGQDNTQTESIIKEEHSEHTLINVPLVQRKIYSDSIGLGKSIFEFRPQNPHANSEFLSLIEELNLTNKKSMKKG